MKMKKYLKFKAGFSLMEILVVLFIVSTALLGILSLIIQNIKVQNINRNNLIASSLSQEGIELIRQIRDDNWQNGLAYDYGLADNYYRVDYRTNELFPVSWPKETALYLKDGFYVHQYSADGVLEPTIFSRRIAISKLTSEIGQPLQVRSIVSWTDHSRPAHYELQTLLYDWR